MAPITDSKIDMVISTAKRDLCRALAAMPRDIRQRLLNDPEQRLLVFQRQPPLATDAEIDAHSLALCGCCRQVAQCRPEPAIVERGWAQGEDQAAGLL